MLYNKQYMIGVYSSGAANQAQLSNLKITTSTGVTLVDWGDGTSQYLDSGTATNHTFFCPDTSAPEGFWNNITVCI